MPKKEKGRVKLQHGKTLSAIAELIGTPTDEELCQWLAEFQVACALIIPAGLQRRHRDMMIMACIKELREFSPKDNTEIFLASLSVALKNASMASLYYAAETDAPQVRAEERRNANRGARTVIELLEARDKHRARCPQTQTAAPQNRENALQRFYDNIESMRQRMAAAGYDLPVMERSKAEILASLPEDEYQAFRRGELFHRRERPQEKAKAGEHNRSQPAPLMGKLKARTG